MKTRKNKDVLGKPNQSTSRIELNPEEIENKFYENIVDTVREPLLILDKDLRVVKASRSFLDFFKVSSDETIGKLIYDLGNKQWDIPKLRELLETILPEKTVLNDFEVEHIFRTIGKRFMLLNARQIERAFGKEKVILLAIEDVTERKRDEKTLRKKNQLTSEYLEILLEHAHTPIIIWDSSLLINRFNHEFEKLSGYDSSEVIYKPIEMLFPKDKADSMIDLLKNNLSEKNSEAIEIDILTKDKTIKTVLWNSTNIFDGEDKNIVATIAQDITNRKQAENKLGILETRYRRLFESAKDGILILDAETGEIIDVNPFLCDLLEYSKEKFIDKELWQIGFFKDIAANKEKFLEFQQNTYVRYAELPLETATGRMINVEFVSTVYIVNQRKVIQCNIRDITERKQAEELLQETKERYRTFFENSMDGILLTRPDGKILSANRAACKMFGYTENELINLGRSGLVDTTDPQLPFLLEERAAKGKVRCELTFIRKDGIHLPCEISSAIFKNREGREHASMIIRDISERKQIQQKIKDSEKRFRAIFDQAPFAIALIDIQGHILISNEKLSKMIGYSLEELSKMKFTDFTYPEDIDKDMKRFTDLTSGKIYSYTLEKRFVHKNGSIVWVNLSVSLLSDDSGTLIEILGMAEDITERKNSENELKESEEKFRIITENSADAIFITDDQGRYHYVNTKSVQMLGYSKEEMMRFTIADISPKDRVEEYFLLFKQLFDFGFAKDEIDLVTKDGNLIAVDFNAVLLPNGFIYASCRDISERIEIQNKIKFQAELLFNVGQAVIATDLLGRVIYWNNAAENIYGWTIDEAMGKNIIDLTPAEQTQKQASEIMKQLITGNSWSGEFLVKRKDGSSFTSFVTDTPINDSNGKLIGVIGISSDITEKKLAEDKIMLIAHALKSINECVSITDIKDKIIFVNESFLRTYGYKENELLGKSINLVRSVKNSPDLTKEILPSTTQGGWQGELWNKRKDGSEFQIYLSTTSIYDKENKLLGLIGVAKDITESKLNEQELIKAKDKAEESDKMKSEFLAQMSHEIRTPINAVLGYIDYLKELFGEPKDPDAVECFSGIDIASNRIIRTIDLILNAAELQTGSYQPHFVKIDLDKEILQKLYKERLLSANQRELELIYNCKLDDPEIFVDDYSITQIFVNLIDNALKYTKKGKVEILLTKNKDGNTIVEIKDTGIGIAEEFLPKLFNAFTQEEQGYSRSFEGNGLGLALVKNYCEVNNARIEVESVKNVGSTFRVIFDKKFIVNTN